ncbi:aldo/keto reductase [Sphingobacterium sp. ML3W]|uniref:aldo/keto reductase n=1 Tax=Sphingobacterium sp. ML3W TaxID=1538644 RepID=UPI00249C8803|nr:aldo/keto reductase [Sphingobacterium sp. ML3W]WFA78197.1 aldo/keto reductase [Sphingobacterium sp. ML3W]
MTTLLNKIGLGTVQFGAHYGISNSTGKTPLQEVGEIVRYSESIGIKYLDTAFAYGDAEDVLGKFDLDSFRIISKYIPSEITLPKQFEISLDRLGIEAFYGYMAHRPYDLIENRQNWEFLMKLKTKGKVKKIGASFNSVEELEEIFQKGLELDIVQVPLNYFDHRFDAYIKALHEKGVEIHTRSTFLQGLFFCAPDSLDMFFDEVKPYLETLQQLDNLSVRLLRYVLEKDYVDVVNIGVNDLNQFKENILTLGKMHNKLPLLNHKFEDKILMPSEWPK